METCALRLLAQFFLFNYTLSMYQTRPSSGSYSRSSNTSFRPSRGGGYGGGRRSFSGRSGRRYRPTDYSKYIKKAEFVKAEVYTPNNKFSDFAIESSLKQNIIKKGFEHPTPIQDQAIPLILEGRDIIGIANTGTGKTGAFLIPLIDKILKAKKTGQGQQTLVIVPTRELAQQIEEELRSLTFGLQVFSVCCVGGMDIRQQIFKLRKPNQFVIGTPGRLVDLVERKILNLASFSNIVLDEVDRMLDMGFVEDIQFLISKLATKKQSLFFSATMDRSLEGLANSLLVDPVTISVKTGTTSANVDQDIVKIERGQQKIEVLHELLNSTTFTKVLIFGKTKNGVEMIYEELSDRGFKVESIHGDKSQGKRQRALQNFKIGRVDILVATDVAARGLDIKEVSHVINYDIPENYDDYIHRIGRTGRAGQPGIALTFVE